MELNEVLSVAVQAGASDIHLKAGLPPIFRIDGALQPMQGAQRMPPEEVARLAYSTMNNWQKERFKERNELDLAYGVPSLGRFRVNVFQQRGAVGVVLRVIPFKIRAINDLFLPKVIGDLSLSQRGLILVTGTTGSGKSTTLAAMIDHINTHRTCHVMTIEDPIEFLIRDKRSIVNQREIGVDTINFGQALKSALRQDPDVILVGEMRDLETIETALLAAETGHLVMSTLHTLDATETINRIIAAFPPYQQGQIRLQLASVLKGVVSQRLLPRADRRGRAPAVEVLIATERVRSLVEDNERTKEIPQAIAEGHMSYGMQTFDQSLMNLLQQKLITFQDALRNATNPNDFALRVRGVAGTSDSKWDNFDDGKPTASTAQQQKTQRFARPSTPGTAAPGQGRPSSPNQPAQQKSSPGTSSPGTASGEFEIERFSE